MKRGFRLASILLVGLMPAGAMKCRLLSLFRGFKVHAGARLSPCLLINVDGLDISSGAKIGLGTVLRDLRMIKLGEDARISQWNWISAARPLRRGKNGEATLHLASNSAITSRHYLDCSGGISVGKFSTLAGVRSTLITHGIDLMSSKQTTGPIDIGDYCLISSSVKITPGVRIADCILVGMGSVVADDLLEPQHLYVGSPARPKKPVAGRYFERKVGSVGS